MKKYILIVAISLFFMGCSHNGLSIKDNDINNYLASDFTNNVTKYFIPAQTEFTLHTKTPFEFVLDKQLREKGYAISNNGIFISEQINHISQEVFFVKYQVQQCIMSRSYNIYQNTISPASNWNISNCGNQKIINENIFNSNILVDSAVVETIETPKNPKLKKSKIKQKSKNTKTKHKKQKKSKVYNPKKDDSFTIIFSKDSKAGGN